MNKIQSGCLEMIADEKETAIRMDELIYKLANYVWNCALMFESEQKRFKISKNEKKLLCQKADMPNIFIPQFVKYFPTWQIDLYIRYMQDTSGQDSGFYFLFHKQKPNTKYQVYDDVINKKIITCKCNKCGRIIYTNRFTFGITKWKNCGIDCTKAQVQDFSDFSNNLLTEYKINRILKCLEKKNANLIEYDFSEHKKQEYVNTINPYGNLPNGIFLTSVNDYYRFSKFSGLNIDEPKNIYNYCQNHNAKLYICIQNGFYGFFSYLSEQKSTKYMYFEWWENKKNKQFY